jgi:hypothetical protein
MTKKETTHFFSTSTLHKAAQKTIESLQENTDLTSSNSQILTPLLNLQLAYNESLNALAKTVKFAENTSLKAYLDEKSDLCLKQWYLLKNFITASFPVPTHPYLLNLIGYEYVAAAIEKNWESLKALMQQSIEFITEHVDELKYSPMIPKDFSQTTKLAFKEFQKALCVWQSSLRDEKVATAELRLANLRLYKYLIDIYNTNVLNKSCDFCTHMEALPHHFLCENNNFYSLARAV